MLREVKILLWVLGVIDVVAIHVAFGYLLLRKPVAPITESTVQYVDQCGEECKSYVNQALQAKQAKQAPQASPTPETKIIYQTAPKTKVKSTTYVTIAGSGSTTATDWVNVAGSDFYFSPQDYPGLVSVYFEANIKLMTGSGRADVRLFDATHGIGVQGSEVSTRAGTDTIVESGQASFWAGKNLIRVQIKSLTTESAVYNSGRLRIVTEN